MKNLLYLLLLIPSYSFGQGCCAIGIPKTAPVQPTFSSPHNVDTTKVYTTRTSTFAGYDPASTLSGTNNSTTGSTLKWVTNEIYGVNWGFSVASPGSPTNIVTDPTKKIRWGWRGAAVPAFQNISVADNANIFGPITMIVGASRVGVNYVDNTGAGGSNFKLVNALIKGVPGSGAGIQINSKNTNAKHYNGLVTRWVKYDSMYAEGAYKGGTDAAYDSITYDSTTDEAGYVMCREFDQRAHIRNAYASGLSSYLGGINTDGSCGGAGQNNTIQDHDINGIFKNFVISGSPTAGNFATVGYKLYNGYLGFTTNMGFFVDINTAYFMTGGGASSDSPRITKPTYSTIGGIYGDTLIFDNIIINKETAGNLTYAFQSAELHHWILFRNCTISNKFTHIVQNINGTTTHVIGDIGDHGNVSSSSIITPTWVSTDTRNPNFMVLSAPLTYIAQGMGAFNRFQK